MVERVICRIRKDGNVTIPKQIRESLNLSVGDWVNISLEEDVIRVVPIEWKES